MRAQVALIAEPQIFLLRHVAGQDVAIHRCADVVAEEQIEREKSPLVHEQRLLHHVGRARMNVFGTFAVDEDGIGPQIKDRAHRQHAGLAAVLDVGDESLVAHQPLVPPPKGG